jgi:hypothetical protein
MQSLRTLLRSTSSQDGNSPKIIPSSPSLSDFSSGAAADFAEYTQAAPTEEPGNPFTSFASLHRGSLDSGRSSSPTFGRPSDSGNSSSSCIWGRLSMDSAMSPRASAGRPNLAAASIPFPGAAPSFHRRSSMASPAMNIPQLRASADNVSADDGGFAQTAPTGGPAEPPHRRHAGRPEGKIDGMDYYGWCELLRSSSL